MFKKLKWKLSGKLKVKRNKIKNEVAYILEFAPDDYETLKDLKKLFQMKTELME